MRATVGDLKNWAVAVALALIMLGATAARFVDLPTNPGGLYPDEAAEAVSARHILRDPTYRPVFIVEDGWGEALYAYSVAIGFAIAGDNVLTLRAVSAVWGILGVLAAWLVARRFGRGVGLAAAAWAAGSLWLIAISRDGMRNTFTPFFLGVALIALLAWHARPSRWMSVIAGATLAVSTLYTYQPLKLLPFLLLSWMLWLRRIDPIAFRRLLRDSGWFAASFLIVAAPMIVFALSDPQSYMGRVIGVLAINPALETDLPTHILRTLGMFAFVGDPNARHNVASLPVLSWPLVALTLLGLAVLWRHRNDARHSLLLLSIPVFFVPPLLAAEGGSPHFLRALGLSIPTAVVIGFGAQELSRQFSQRISRNGARSGLNPGVAEGTSAVALAVLFLVLGVSSASTYLARPEVDRQVAFRYDLVAMAELAQPTDAVIASEFDAFTILYVHDDPQPLIVRPGEPITDTAVDRVLAVREDELRLALGGELAATAVVVARDTLGQPTVWAVTLR